MTISRGLTRLGLVGSLAAVLLTLSMAVATVTSAQAPPAVYYGKNLPANATVEAFIGGRSCGSTRVTAQGEWVLQIAPTAACAPTAGAAVSFTLNGAATTVTPAVNYQPGGTPSDVANGLTLQAVTATATASPTVTATVATVTATATTGTGAVTPTVTATTGVVTPPRTGNAGLADDGGSSLWLALGLGALGLAAAAAGSRVYSLRRR